MAFFVGNNGSIVVAKESTYGTDPGSGYDTLFGIGSTLALKNTLIAPAHLSINPVANTDCVPRFVDGEITCNWSEEASVMDELLKSMFTGGGATAYTMSGAPANASVTAVTAYSTALGYVYTGLVATSFSMEINPNDYPVVTMGFIGQNCVKDVSSPATGTPDIANIAAPSAVTEVTIDGTALGAKNITINANREYTGGDRAIVGASMIHQPVESGVRSMGLSMTVELSDDTGFDSVDVLDQFLSATTTNLDLGTIIVGEGQSEVTLTDCRIVGDPPSLSAGMTEFPINVEATAWSMAALNA
jgi:hypothetical protein